VTSYPIFRKGLPASTVTSGTSTGMNSLRPGGTLLSMLSQWTLRTQARMEPRVIQPSSILSAGEHRNTSRKHKKVSPSSLPFGRGDFPLNFVKSRPVHLLLLLNQFLLKSLLHFRIIRNLLQHRLEDQILEVIGK
jgi:hypothetical protein